MCILVEMGTLLELKGIQESGIARLHGDDFHFNGNLLPVIFSDKQLQISRLESLEMNSILMEIGWIGGAVINLVRMTHSKDEDVPRLKFVLKGTWVKHDVEKRFRKYVPLLSLLFPLDADILQPD